MTRWTYRLEDADVNKVFCPIGLFEADIINGHRWGRPFPHLTMASARAAGTVYIIMNEYGHQWCWVPARGADLRVIRHFCDMQTMAAELRRAA